MLNIDMTILPLDWGVLCGDSWSLLEAMVVCKMLGLNFASNAAQTNFFGGNSSNMVLSGVQCRGNETRLDQCIINDPYPLQCPGNKDQIAGVVCTNSRLYTTIFHDNIRKTLCIWLK